MQKTWFITGATRGFGVEIAKAAMHVAIESRPPAAAAAMAKAWVPTAINYCP